MYFLNPPFPIEKQLEFLENRGLIIRDQSTALRFIENISYCRFGGYVVPFLKNRDVFLPGTTFKHVQDLYSFDHELRILVFDALEHVEIAVRARAASHHGGRYGPFGYTVPENFGLGFKHHQWLAGIEEEVRRSGENFVRHFRARHPESSHLPVWLAAEVFSFGALSFFFRGMKFSDQKAVARVFGVSAPVFQSWTHCFVYIRNLCAHHSRLWNRQLGIRPILPEGSPEWGSPRPMGNNRIFSVLSVLQYCGRQIGRDLDLARRLALLFQAYPGVNRNAMGFPEDWENYQIWRQEGTRASACAAER